MVSSLLYKFLTITFPKTAYIPHKLRLIVNLKIKFDLR